MLLISLNQSHQIMKKIILNTNPFILLLAPVFMIAVFALLKPMLNLQLPNVQTEIIGFLNRRTVFQVLCEMVGNYNW